MVLNQRGGYISSEQGGVAMAQMFHISTQGVKGHSGLEEFFRRYNDNHREIITLGIITHRNYYPSDLFNLLIYLIYFF